MLYLDNALEMLAMKSQSDDWLLVALEQVNLDAECAHGFQVQSRMLSIWHGSIGESLVHTLKDIAHALKVSIPITPISCQPSQERVIALRL
jgi:hypothetical protein